ncbi:MAG: ATP-binding protein [Lachnospiraceae bacterium]|nr:ATP-binding protein [Lachnospiraceae bacterium]
MLSGPPGTGKTMTAQTIAGELGLPLYQVDLSGVMDKYIGETEKHLEEIFSFAEKANVVLFFDEADALFGKRGEVLEGRDRYANMEVAYILQRIEQFEGIVILSTNFYNNIDKAFLRRMKYVLKYGMPDKDIRHRIWTSNLPKEQFREELDIDYLASQFEFTGGMIKNVVLSASVSAVYEERCLSMEHLLQAIRAEYEKMEWPVSPGMWGEYEYLMM